LLAAELRIGLIDHQHGGGTVRTRVGGGSGQGAHILQRKSRSGGIVRAGEQHDGGAPAADGGDRLVDVHGEVVPARCAAVGGERVPGVLGVHGVGGGEGEHAA